MVHSLPPNMKNKWRNIYDQLVSWSWGWLTPRPSAGDEWPHSVAFLSGWHRWWLGLGPLYEWLQSCRFRRADEAEIYQTVPTEKARRAVRLPVCWPRQKQRGVLLQGKKTKQTSQPLFTVSFIRKERKRQLKRWPGLRSMQCHFLVLLPWTPPAAPHVTACPSLTSQPGLSWWGQKWRWDQRAPLYQKWWCPVVRYISSTPLCRLWSLTFPTHLQHARTEDNVHSRYEDLQ